MRIPVLPLALALAASLPLTARATTWDEPWHEEVVARSSTLGLYEVLLVDGNRAKLKLVHRLAGEETPAELTIAGYAIVRQTSSHAGERVQDFKPWLEPGRNYYLLLVHGKNGAWQLPTPSSGAAMVRDGGIVEATYRISMHQALVPKADYELTQTCVFQSLHGKACDAKVKAFIDATLKLPVAQLGPQASEADANRFFLQHAALETAALAHVALPVATVDRFSQNHFFHVEISTLRYISRSTLADKWQRISRFACDGKRDEFSRRYAVFLLDQGKATSEAASLKACVKQAPAEGEAMLVGDIMDPRVGTHFPDSLRQGITELLADWDKAH